MLRPPSRSKERCWARSATCHRSKLQAAKLIFVRTSFLSGRCSTRWSPDFLHSGKGLMRRPRPRSFAMSRSVSVPECCKRPLPSFGTWSAAWPRTPRSATPPHRIWLATSPQCATVSPRRLRAVRSLVPTTCQCNAPHSSDANTKRLLFVSS